MPAPSAEALRVRRFLLLSGAQELCWPYWQERINDETGEIVKRSEFRLAVCCREPVGEEVKVYRHGSAVGYSGLMRCGNVWGCVICAAKVLRRRGEQIAALFDAVHAGRGAAVMVTFTASHRKCDGLGDLLGRQKAALRFMQQQRAFRPIVADRTGQVVATEVTYNERSGWHPHSHQAWFWPEGFAPDPEMLAARLFPAWQRACQEVGLTTLEHFKGHRVGVDVRVSLDASAYLTKWGREREWSLASEVTAGRMKLGRRESLTPWGILEEAIIRGKDSEAAKLWIEYLRGTKGFHCVSLRGARKLLLAHNLPTNYDDWADANDAGEGEVVGSLSVSGFRHVVSKGGLGRLLEAGRNGGLAALDKELQLLSTYSEGVNHGLT